MSRHNKTSYIAVPSIITQLLRICLINACICRPLLPYHGQAQQYLSPVQPQTYHRAVKEGREAGQAATEQSQGQKGEQLAIFYAQKVTCTILDMTIVLQLVTVPSLIKLFKRILKETQHVSFLRKGDFLQIKNNGQLRFVRYHGWRTQARLD